MVGKKEGAGGEGGGGGVGAEGKEAWGRGASVDGVGGAVLKGMDLASCSLLRLVQTGGGIMIIRGVKLSTTSGLKCKFISAF